jgi:hypothetical protein
VLPAGEDRAESKEAFRGLQPFVEAADQAAKENQRWLEGNGRQLCAWLQQQLA